MANCLPQETNTLAVVDQLTPTTMEPVECHITCEIKNNHSSCYGWRSQVFAADKNQHHAKWYLSVSGSNSCIMLTLLSAADKCVRFSWKVFVKDSNEALQIKSDSKVVTALPGTSTASARDEVFREDSLTIVVHIHMVNSSPQQTGGVVTPRTANGTIIEDLGRLLNDAEYSDVTIIVGELTIPAHKNILALRSDVFAAMLREESEEKKINQIIINGFDSSVIREMLRYIYTGDTSRVSQMTGELLTAADDYALEGLKKSCISQLYSYLSTGTVVQALISAHLYSVHELKQEAINFINAHFSTVIKTAQFKYLVKNYPPLMLDILAKQ